MMHQMQLMVQWVLERVDSRLVRLRRRWKYFGTVAKILHLWREHVRACFEKWVARFGNGPAMKHCAKLPPRVVSGRWGSIRSGETAIETAGCDQLCPVLTDVLSKKALLNIAPAIVHLPLPDAVAEPMNPSALADQSGDLDSMRVEAVQAHKEKIGRWSREALAAVADHIFWSLVRFVPATRETFEHGLAWLQRVDTADDLNENGGKISQLQAFKASQMAQSFQRVLEETDWDAVLQVSTLSDDMAAELHELILELILGGGANYDQRINQETARPNQSTDSVF